MVLAKSAILGQQGIVRRLPKCLAKCLAQNDTTGMLNESSSGCALGPSQASEAQITTET